MLTKTLTMAVLAGVIAYATGALAHDPNPQSYGNGYSKGHTKNLYGGAGHSAPYGSPYGAYGSSGWSLSFSLGSPYGGYRDRYYYDRNFHGNRSHYFPNYHPGIHDYIPHHAVGPACRNYGYHRH
jgi:hypothetical protein